ncbi:MAG: hypothetical protein ABL964_01445 [Steroidobacteraceae bacterium]
MTEALAEKLNYTGVGCAQFVVDANGGVCFLELNARLGANSAAVCAAGLDLPRLFLDSLLARPVAKVTAEVGRKYVWFDGDMIGLASCLRSGRICWQVAAAWFLRSIRAQMGKNDRITWSARDPWPMLPVATNVVHSLFSAVVRRLAGLG